MIYKQTEARLVRSIGVAIFTGVGAYFAQALYSSFASSQAVDILSDPASISAFALLIAFIAAGFYTMFINPKTSNFFIEVEAESRKVTWPQWLTVKGHTKQVIVVMLILLAYLFVVDSALSWLSRNLL